MDVDVPDERFALVTAHRFENLVPRSKLESLLDLVDRIASRMKALFILHPPTARALDQAGLRRRLEENPRIELRPRYDYFRFVKLLDASELLATDGGSNQEEASYLGKHGVRLTHYILS